MQPVLSACTCSSQPLGRPICSSKNAPSSWSGCWAAAQGGSRGGHEPRGRKASSGCGAGCRKRPRTIPTLPARPRPACPAPPAAACLAPARARAHACKEQHPSLGAVRRHQPLARPARIAWALRGGGMEGGVQALVCSSGQGLRWEVRAGNGVRGGQQVATASAGRARRARQQGATSTFAGGCWPAWMRCHQPLMPGAAAPSAQRQQRRHVQAAHTDPHLLQCRVHTACRRRGSGRHGSGAVPHPGASASAGAGVLLLLPQRALPVLPRVRRRQLRVGRRCRPQLLLLLLLSRALLPRRRRLPCRCHWSCKWARRARDSRSTEITTAGKRRQAGGQTGGQRTAGVCV